MASARLTLLIPNLLWPEPADRQTLADLPLPALETLLARARFQRADARPFEVVLADRFGRAADAPLAALRLLGEADTRAAGQGRWLCADPVHLKFHQERLVLADAAVLALTADEASALVATLNAECGDVGRFHVGSPDRWYLQLPDGDDIAGFAPLTAVAGRTVDSRPPAGADGARLQRWLNEIQILLHAHPVNAARGERGLPPVNSLWLWGGGNAATGGRVRSDPPPYFAVWADHPLAAGLAHADSVPAHPLPAALDRLLKQVAPGSRHLVVLDAALTPALYEDGPAWRQALARFEADWFAPLAGAGLEWTLVAPTAYGVLTWESGGLDRLKLWRRRRPLAAWAEELAA